MSDAALPSPPKIDVAASVRFAYAVVIDHWRLAISRAWLPFAIVLLTGLVELLGDQRWFVQIPAFVADAGAFAVFIVRWHRFILLGEMAAEGFISAGWAPYVWTTAKLWLLLAIGLVPLLLAIAIISKAIDLSLTALADAGLIDTIFLPLGLFWARVSLAFPAAAIARRISLFTGAWDLVSGNYWRLVACLVACCAPFAVLTFGVGSLGGLLSIPRVIVFIIQSTVWVAGAAVVASLLSEVYRRLSPPAPWVARRAS